MQPRIRESRIIENPGSLSLHVAYIAEPTSEESCEGELAKMYQSIRSRSMEERKTSLFAAFAKTVRGKRVIRRHQREGGAFSVD